MRLDPYLNFNGNCAEAMAYYRDVLGGTIAFQMTWGESPMAAEVPENWQGKLMHTSLSLGETVIMACDAPPGRFKSASGITISIPAKTFEEGERIFGALAEGGVVGMPYTETFWAKGFGMVVDRFGTPWMVNCEKEMVVQ